MNMLRRVLGLTCVLLAALCALAAAQSEEQPEELPAGEEPEAAPAREPVDIPLDATLRLIIQPTILGLVPPRGPEGYGEVFVRIVDAGRNSITVHYEIKEEVPLPPGEEPQYRPGADTKTRIRRGEITAGGIRRSKAILPPLYWGDGALETDSSLLWLSRESFRQLSSDGGCALDLRYTGPVEGEAAAELTRAIDRLAADAEPGGDPQFSLEDAEAVLYPCVVNGERARLAALYARDSLGLAEYWVLDDPDNPLVLKLTYGLGDAADDAGMSFVQKGGGYAITSIDFSPDWDPRR